MEGKKAFTAILIERECVMFWNLLTYAPRTFHGHGFRIISLQPGRCGDSCRAAPFPLPSSAKFGIGHLNAVTCALPANPLPPTV